MRPQSIVMFERLFLASLVLGLINFVMVYQTAAALVESDLGAQRLGLGSGFLVAVTTVVYAVDLLLWFLIARRASVAAKWILVVFTVIGVLSVLPSLAGSWNTTLVLSLVTYALEVLAVVYLFRPDAKAWLAGDGQADPAAFD